ncbi:MAG: hypothetical protein AB1918_12700 [Pseudomonadota bacterium]
MALTASMAGRPAFELQFANLQNTLIDRLNKQITELNNSGGNRVDAFLLLERSRLTYLEAALGNFRGEVARAYNSLDSVSGDLDDLQGLLGAAATDPSDFDALLRKLNQTIDLTKVIDGTVIGVLTPDGVADLKENGVVRVQRDGEWVKVTSYADFADAAEASAAVNDAITRVAQSFSVMEVKADLAASAHDTAAKDLTAIKMQIEAVKAEDSADKAQEIQELQDQYAVLLKSLSIAFEGSQSMAEQMAKQMFLPPDMEKGSVINMFT